MLSIPVGILYILFYGEYYNKLYVTLSEPGAQQTFGRTSLDSRLSSLEGEFIPST